MLMRVLVLSALIAIGAAGTAVSGCRAKPEDGPKIATIDKVRDNLYVIKGGGGNTAAFITGTGVVLVDTKLPGWGQPILDKVRTVTDHPVTMIINTHAHPDHVRSNEFFPTTVDIVAQENTKVIMQRMPGFKGDNAKFLPKKTFSDRMSVLGGKDRIDLYYFGAGHTDGDAIVVFPALRAAHFGDLFAGKYPPTIDTSGGGSAIAYPGTLSKAVAGIENVDTIITGHSDTVMTWDDLREYADFNAEFLAWAEQQVKTGTSPKDAAAAFKTPARYQGYAEQPWRVVVNVEIVNQELKQKTP
jgi:glyoxylase-like metal-dependent hydrolase (beta-lactamase superfamily II)